MAKRSSGEFGLESVVVRASDQVSSELDEETVLMSIESGKYYGMQDVAGRIWALIAEPRSIAELCAALRDEYDVTPERCEREVIEFVERLAEERLLKIVQ